MFLDIAVGAIVFCAIMLGVAVLLSATKWDRDNER